MSGRLLVNRPARVPPTAVFYDNRIGHNVACPAIFWAGNPRGLGLPVTDFVNWLIQVGTALTAPG
jgi:hypothetical protein